MYGTRCKDRPTVSPGLFARSLVRQDPGAHKLIKHSMEIKSGHAIATPSVAYCWQAVVLARTRTLPSLPPNAMVVDALRARKLVSDLLTDRPTRSVCVCVSVRMDEMWACASVKCLCASLFMFASLIYQPERYKSRLMNDNALSIDKKSTGGSK